MSRLLIIGAGGHGAVVADCATAMNRWDELAYLDDFYSEGECVSELPVLGPAADWDRFVQNETDFVIALGDNAKRYLLLAELASATNSIATLVHPSSIVSDSAQIGAGSVIFANAVVNARAVVGRAAIINTAATVDHDCRLGDAVHLSPGVHLAGGVTIGHRTWVGIGATVNERVCIGDDVHIGASAAVVRDLASGIKAVGVPAERVIGESC